MNKKVIFWDFDGVLIDSNSIRDLGFREVLREYPSEEVEQLIVFHQANGGLSRYVKFRHFFENVRGEELTEETLLLWANRFSRIMKELLVNPSLLIKETVDFVKRKHLNYRMHITSGSDEKELRFLCDQLGLSSYFISIHGSPTPKKELVRGLMDFHNYTQAECVLVGDSVNDKEAAFFSGIDFVGYNNSVLEKLNDNSYMGFFTT